MSKRNKMKITKRQLKRIIREQSHGAPAGWTKADWDAKIYNAGYEDALDGKEPDLELNPMDRSAYSRGYMAGEDRFMREGQGIKETIKITKRHLKRIIREEAHRLSEDSVDLELDHLRDNIHDDIEHIKDIHSDIEDDHEEELHAEKEKYRHDESRERSTLKHRLTKIIRASLGRRE